MFELIEGEHVIFWQLIIIIDLEYSGINKYMCTVFIRVRQNLGHSFIQVYLWLPGMIKHICVFLHNSFEHSPISDACYHLFHLLYNRVTFYQQLKERHPYLFLMELVLTVSVLSLMAVTLCFCLSCQYIDTELHFEQGEKDDRQHHRRHGDGEGWFISFNSMAKSSHIIHIFYYQIQTHLFH